MAYDGLVNYSIVRELKNRIINGKVDKIYEPNFEEIILGIYCDGKKYALNLVINSKYYRANLTTNAKPNPNVAPNFCMTLRKYLIGTHITKIYTKNLERIIFIEFEGHNKLNDFSSKKLIIELMGKHSNIILVNNDDTIIDSLKHFSVISGSYRNIFAGSKYELPKDDKLDFMLIKDSEEFYRVLENNSNRLNTTSLVNIISNTFTGISKNSLKAFELDLSISDVFNKENSDKLFDYITNIVTIDCICEAFVNDYYVKPSFTDEKQDCLQINFFLDDYYTAKEETSTFTTYRDNILKLILAKLNKLNVKLDTINNKIKECKDAEKYKLYGELITSNLYQIDNFNTKSISLENYYDNNTLITIPLDSSITPSENAKRFFKKYKKLKNAKQFVDTQKTYVTSEIQYLESIVYEIGTSKTLQDINAIYSELQENDIGIIDKRNNKITNQKSKKSFQQKGSKKFNGSISDKIGEPIKYEIDGFTVLVGKNNKQNDYLSTKLANDTDIWFHVKDFHGSHVILRTENKEPSQDTLNKCAELAKQYSKASESSNIMVDYTYIKYVKKPSGSKPGMVIYTNNKSVIVK